MYGLSNTFDFLDVIPHRSEDRILRAAWRGLIPPSFTQVPVDNVRHMEEREEVGLNH
jgi:hypothetical protein